MGGASGQATDISITAREIIKIKGQLNEILSQHTGRDKAVVEKDTDRNNYMNAKEAIEYGLVDSILRRDDGKAPAK
jgi:ATP-dependent Clp protease protease subunit